jgi:hypothetical protein
MRLTIILSLLMLATSCEIKDDTAFYTFSSKDYNYIPIVYQNVGRIITFKNQQNDEVRIEVKSYTINKKSNGGWNWVGGSSTELYYTEQIIIWLDLMDVGFTDIGDGYCDQLHIIIEKRSNGTTDTSLDVPTFTSHCSSSSLNSTSPYNDLQEMIIGDITYDHVKIFETESNYLFYNESTVNKIYFDFKEGIIGFDDSENNTQYRIINN